MKNVMSGVIVNGMRGYEIEARNNGLRALTLSYELYGEENDFDTIEDYDEFIESNRFGEIDVVIDKDDDDEFIANLISDKTGWLVYGFEVLRDSNNK